MRFSGTQGYNGYMSGESHASKEGLFKRLLKAFKSAPPEALPEVPPSGPHSHDSSKKDKDEHKFSSEVNQLWDMMASPSPKAREFIPDVFSKKSLEIPEVRELIVNLLVKVEDTDIYSDRKWLSNRQNEILRIRSDHGLTMEPKDRKVLEDMLDAITRKQDRIKNVDERISENKEEISAIKKGDPKDTEIELKRSIEAIREVDEIKSDPEIQDTISNLEAYLNKDDSAKRRDDGERSPKGYYLEMVYQKIKNRIQEEYTHLNQTNREEYKSKRQILRKKEEALENLQRKLAHHWGRTTGKLDNEDYREVKDYETHKDMLRKDQNYRDYYFYKTLKPILLNYRRESHRDLTSLQLIQRMEDFMEIISETKDPSGNGDEAYGEKLVSHYTTLKNMIYQSHDTDYYAAHPSQGIEEFIQSTAFFTNGYIDFGFQNPMVTLAKRMYEVALFQIRENHQGYIPRRYLEWNASTRDIPIDKMVRQLMLQAIKNGQLYNHPTDPATGEDQIDTFQRLRPSKGGKLGENEKFTMDDLYGGTPSGSSGWRRQLGDLQIASALKQAKALGLVDMRFLEILAKSKGSGSDMKVKNPNDLCSFNMTGLASVPYEAVVQYLEPVIYKYSRFKIGDRKFNAFFNFMIQDKQSFGFEQIQEIIKLHEGGKQKELEKKYGKKIATRLISQDNPFLFSSMWGTMTGWRASMSTTGWDDWRRERLSTANRLTGVGDSYILHEGGGGHGHHHGSTRNKDGFAKAKVDDYFKYEFGEMKKHVKFFKEEFRDGLLKSGDVRLTEIAKNPIEFEKYWKQTGIPKYQDKIDEKSKQEFKKFHGDKEALVMQLERAYKTRIWAQAVMRSPLIVAREWGKENTLESKDFEYLGQGALRRKIIKDILHFDIPEVGLTQEPTKQQQEQLDRITELEGALASISEKARRENRDLTKEDFDDIVDKPGDKSGDPSSTRDLALRYWYAVQGAVLGATGNEAGKVWYEALGIGNADVSDELKSYLIDNHIDLSDEQLEGLRFHKIDFEKISHINIHHTEGKDYADIFHGHEPHGVDLKNALLTGRMIDKDWRFFFSTEDMGWEYLNVVALGERNPVRRAGDLASHVQFSNGLDKLISPAGGALGYHFNEEEFHKAMVEMWGAISGDDADIAYDTCGRVFYNSMLMYRKMVPKYMKIPFFGWGAAKIKGFIRPMSVMQLLVKDVNHADGFGPQDILKQVHLAENAGYVLPTPENPLTGEVDHWTEWNAHSLEARLGASKESIMYDAGNEVFWLIFILLLWNALKQSTADNAEGGGGGGGGHH